MGASKTDQGTTFGTRRGRCVLFGRNGSSLIQVVHAAAAMLFAKRARSTLGVTARPAGDSGAGMLVHPDRLTEDGLTIGSLCFSRVLEQSQLI